MDVPRKTVLVVDDEEPFLLSLVDALAPHGSLFRVVTALSGAEALELVGRVGPDLVITDLKMAGMDGLERMRQLQAMQPQLPIVVITAYNTPQIEKALAVLRLAAVLDKSLDLGELLRTIVRTLFPIMPRKTAAGRVFVAFAILTLLLVATPFPEPRQPGIAGYARAGAPTGDGPAGQDWRIAICSDPRA